MSLANSLTLQSPEGPEDSGDGFRESFLLGEQEGDILGGASEDKGCSPVTVP